MPPQELPRAARELAAKILAITGPLESIHLSMTRRSGQEDDGLAAAQQELEQALLSLGVRLVSKEEAGVEVAVTMSKNLQGQVWIADISKGDERHAAMVSLASPVPIGGASSLTAILQIRPVFQQELPILDLIRLEDGLIVLDPQYISLYRRGNGWELTRAVTLTYRRPVPRDPRGRLRMDGSSLGAYFSGGLLKLSADLSWVVEMSTDPAWPLETPDAKLVTGRNYFQASGLPPFYSVVRLGFLTDFRLLVTELDGKTGLFSPEGELQEIFDGWGSEIAAITPLCGVDPQVLVVIPGENDRPDSIQAYRISAHRAVAMSPPTQLSGTVTAMWLETGRAAIVLVCHNPSAERYEAFEISATCGR